MAKHTKAAVDNGPMGFVLFTAWIGAVVYFVGKVDGFLNILSRVSYVPNYFLQSIK